MTSRPSRRYVRREATSLCKLVVLSTLCQEAEQQHVATSLTRRRLLLSQIFCILTPRMFSGCGTEAAGALALDLAYRGKEPREATTLACPLGRGPCPISPEIKVSHRH